MLDSLCKIGRILVVTSVVAVMIAPVGPLDAAAGRDKKEDRPASKSAAKKKQRHKRKQERKHERGAKRERKQEREQAPATDPSAPKTAATPGADARNSPSANASPPVARDESAGEAVEILTLGEGADRFWVAFDDDRISVWANRMPADQLLTALHEYGGPTYTCFEPLTRPITLSVIGVRMEDILRKIFDGYNFAYYYEEGRLAHARVLNYIPGRQYKASDPIVPRVDWTRDVLRRTKH